ncbi:MAG: hypothetical protein IPO14_00195 [Saprospiraceae bacterium]|nr:hypothetical protein [Saprospiraceae bacterium]
MKKLIFYLAAYVGLFTQAISGQISVKIDKPMSEADHAEVKNLMASVPTNAYSFKSDIRGKNGNVRKEMGGLQGLNNVQGLMNAMPRTAFEGGANRGGQRGNTMNNGQNRGQSSGSYQPNPGGNQRGMGTNPRSGGVQDPFNSGNQNQNNNQRPNTDIRGNAENSGSMAGNRPGSMVNRSGMAQGKEGEKPESGGGKPDGGGGKPDGVGKAQKAIKNQEVEPRLAESQNRLFVVAVKSLRQSLKRNQEKNPTKSQVEWTTNPIKNQETSLKRNQEKNQIKNQTEEVEILKAAKAVETS